jgi:hypothetical protein
MSAVLEPWHAAQRMCSTRRSRCSVLSTLLIAIMQLALAVKVNIVLHYWIGLLSMHWLLTRAVAGGTVNGMPRPSSRPDRWRPPRRFRR